MPPRPFLDAVAARAALLWVFLRLASFAGSAAVGIPYPDALLGAPASALPLSAVVILIMRIELWRKAELVFLANLGCSFTRVAAFVALECALLETVMRLTLG